MKGIKTIILMIALVELFLMTRTKLKLGAKAKTKAKAKFYYSANLQNMSENEPDNQHFPGSQFDPVQNQVNQLTQGQDCPCESPSCPPCILSKTERKLHERASKDARADQKTQQILVKEADLQEKLFSAAQKYAALVSQYEDEAKDLALKMQKVASEAETARTKMIKAENQAKQLALKQINTMTVYPPHSATKTPELKITNAGFTQTMIKSYEPQYSIKIGETDSNGYIDGIKSAIYNDASTGNVPGLNQAYMKNNLAAGSSGQMPDSGSDKGSNVANKLMDNFQNEHMPSVGSGPMGDLDLNQQLKSKVTKN